MDIIFGIDASGSVRWQGFQSTKQFIEEIIVQEINYNQSRIGFSTFATTTNESRHMQHWNLDELITYTRGLYWSTGWTATRSLLSSSILQFLEYKQEDREQLLLIITDGNPCEATGCPYSVCQFLFQLQLAGIQTGIIAVGTQINSIYTDCIADYFFEVDDYDNLNLDQVRATGSGYNLTEILCPLTSLPDLNNHSTNDTGVYSLYF